MENNYYDILEVNKNASQEIIDRVYKVLVKKYHPDLQSDPEIKCQYEQKMKEINEAYEILSDEQKRKEYDDIIFNNSSDDFSSNTKANKANSNYSDNENTSTNVNANINNIYEDSFKKFQEELQKQEELRKKEQEYYRQQMENTINKAYYDAYIQDLKNRGYKIKYKKSFKDYVRSFVSILIVLLIIVILWHIPFVHNFCIDLYNDNEIIRFFTNIVMSVFW